MYSLAYLPVQMDDAESLMKRVKMQERVEELKKELKDKWVLAPNNWISKGIHYDYKG